MIFLLPEVVSPSKRLKKKVDEAIRDYLVNKAVISALVGVIVWVMLIPMKVPLPWLFGVLTFFLNYIPNFGAIIACTLPVILSVFDPNYGTKDAMANPLLILLLPYFAHFVCGMILEPKLFGHSLDLHPVIVLLSLAFWGVLWGFLGVILSVPITAVIKVVLEHGEHRYAKLLARLLTGKLSQ